MNSNPELEQLTFDSLAFRLGAFQSFNWNIKFPNRIRMEMRFIHLIHYNTMRAY